MFLMVVVERKQRKCGSGGGGRKTIEIYRSKHGRKENNGGRNSGYDPRQKSSGKYSQFQYS